MTLSIREPLSDADSERYVLAAMRALADRSAPIEPLALIQELDARGELDAAGGAEEVGSLADAIADSGGTEYHVKKIRELARRRAADAENDRVRARIRDPRVPLADALSEGAEILTALAEDEQPSGPDDAAARATCALNAPPPEPVQWLAVDFWTRDLGVIAGDGGSFKSTILLHLAGAVAGGYAVFNRFATHRRPVLILSAEDPANVVQMKLEAFVVGQGWDRERVLGNVHYRATDAASLADPRWQRWLRTEARRLMPGLIVLDPWAELIEGNESDNSEQRPTIKFLRSLARSCDGALGIAAHANKQTAEGRRLLDRIRGATSLRDAARVIHFCERSESGAITIRNVKMSRATSLPPLVIESTIEHEPDNRATWTSARLRVKEASEVRENLGETWVLRQIEAFPGIGSTELRKAAVGSGVSTEDVANALRSLETAGRIEYDPAPRGGKAWRVRPCQTHPTGSEFDPADPVHTLSDRVGDAPSDPAIPFRVGRQGQGASGADRLL